MNSEIKKQWVEALRSAKFLQGRGLLKCADGSLCCLGVLRRVMKEPIRKGEKRLTGKQLDHVGLTNEDQSCLMELNDDLGYSFLDIADYIEEKY